MDTESSTARERSKNFSSDEDRKLREEFTKHAEYLRAPQSNKVTNKGKSDIWNQIADSVSALGTRNVPLLVVKPDGRTYARLPRKHITNISVKRIVPVVDRRQRRRRRRLQQRLSC